MIGLPELISFIPRYEQEGRVIKGIDFTTPGYWAALCAYSKHRGLKFDDISFYSDNTKRYAQAIALESAISGADNYPYERKNSGANYSPLVPLNSADDTDRATGTINSCIRHLFATPALSTFVSDLCEVVGDLHDNVWSHGMSSGFSMAQKWQDINSGEDCFEFALADCGLGFLSELKRVGLPIETDEEAIKWCIEEGNSSKKLKARDEWSQRIPSDIISNPIPGIGKAVTTENHHMGLGLAKLVDLVSNYNGLLWLSSGDKTLHISKDGNRSFKTTAYPWQGVALACRFDTEGAKRYKKGKEDDVTDSLINLLRL
jgi:hypothetical protein